MAFGPNPAMNGLAKSLLGSRAYKRERRTTSAIGLLLEQPKFYARTLGDVAVLTIREFHVVWRRQLSSYSSDDDSE